MTDTLQLIAVAMGGGGATFLAQAAAGWWRTRGEKYKTDAEITMNRDKLTLDLLKAARDEAAAVRKETVSVHAVHLEEALDHLHALLNANDGAERDAAERRARAFLRRMRPSIGDIRNHRQTMRSAQSLAERDGLPGDDE
jgi:hypothetical protein